MADLKTYMPHIRRALAANIILLIYFFSPSFLSFVTILIAISAILFQNPNQTCKKIFNCKDQCNVGSCTNECFDKFKNLTILQQLLVLVGLKLAIDFIWLIPTCVIIILATQVFSVWGLLREFGVLDLAKKYIGLARDSVEKVVAMIPRYQGK